MVENVKKEHGFNRALEAIELAKGTWDYHENKKVDKEEKYQHLKEPLDQIIDENPEYGGRKIKAELQKEYGYCHGRELLYELMEMWGLKKDQQARNTDRSGYRKAIEQAGDQANLVAGMGDVQLFEVAYTDFTELAYAGEKRKAYLMPIIGHTSKIVFGWAVGKSANTELAFRAWERAVEMFGELDVDYEGLIVHQDRDSVYTGDEWVNRLIVQEGISLSYSMNGAKGNTHMESFNGHFKKPVESIFVTSETIEKLTVHVADRVDYWNNKRMHETLGNQTPMEFVKEER